MQPCVPKNCSIPGCTSRSDKEDLQAFVVPWPSKRPIPTTPVACIYNEAYNHQRAHTSVQFAPFWGSKIGCFPYPHTVSVKRVCCHAKDSFQRTFATTPPQLEDQHYEALDKAQGVINTRDERIELKQEVVSMRVEEFRLQIFAGSDSDILFYTGLPTYQRVR